MCGRAASERGRAGGAGPGAARPLPAGGPGGLALAAVPGPRGPPEPAPAAPPPRRPRPARFVGGARCPAHQTLLWGLGERWTVFLRTSRQVT